MAYEKYIPTAKQPKNTTQEPLLNNFSDIDTVFSVDHVALNEADQGKHSKVTIVPGDAPVTASDEIALYNKVFNKKPSLFLREEGEGTEYLLFTPERIGNEEDESLAYLNSTGYTKIAGGFLLKWGIITKVAVGPTVQSTSYTFPTETPAGDTIPAFNGILHYNAIGISQYYFSNVGIATISNTALTIYAQSELVGTGGDVISAYYFVLGTYAT